MRDGREQIAEEPAVVLAGIQQLKSFLPNGLVARMIDGIRQRHLVPDAVVKHAKALIDALGRHAVRAGSVETCHFHRFRGRKFSLRLQEDLDDRIVRREPGVIFRRGKVEPEPVAERITQRLGAGVVRAESAVPHQLGIEDRVHHQWCTPLIPRTHAVRADNVVVVHADSDRLCVAKAVGGRMTAAAAVVVMERMNGVEPQQAAEVRELRLQTAPKTRLKLGLDVPREAVLPEDLCQAAIQHALAVVVFRSRS